MCDDFSAGLRSRIPEDVPIVEGDIADTTALRGIFNTFGVTGVVHLSAKKATSESVDLPQHYYKENVTGLQSVFGAMVISSIDNFVYSSSAAVYGPPNQIR